MRVVVAPDKFAGTLTAVEAAGAIADGWRSTGRDEVDLVPLSDGGPGFVDVLHAALGGHVVGATVAGPLHAAVTARYLRDGGTAYLETAQACGLELIPPARRDPTRTTTYGVGELLAAARGGGARRCVLGLGGSATNDGGAGMLAALGAEPGDGLRGGGLALRRLAAVEVGPARARLADTDLVVATDVDSPLLGPHGASAVFGPQKGASRAQVRALDRALAHWAGLVEDQLGEQHAGEPGAGAAGGLGFGLYALGARRRSGIEAVLAAVRLEERVRSADLVVTGEGSFDAQSLRGKVPSGVAGIAARHGVPCVVLAGRVTAEERSAAAAGICAAWSLADFAGSVEAAMARPAKVLSALAARLARTWREAPRPYVTMEGGSRSRNGRGG